ncbi:MAG: response regulator [Planctomycetota bacterium]
MVNFISKLFGKKKNTKGSILLVDDEPGVLQVLSLQLENMGYDITGVEAAESAMAQIQKSKKQFKLFILDVMLGGQNGIQLAKKIRKNKATSKRPIIIMSGALAPSEMKKIKDEIPNAEVMLKPIKMDKLKAAVEKLLSGAAVVQS